mmetsp:Transcript_64903/g.107715  ORF Transcript_64903/g.107715 Transcript_64903/m.107715 type:complete len:110 (+) Transcript_64903:1920-2249(+)
MALPLTRRMWCACFRYCHWCVHMITVRPWPTSSRSTASLNTCSPTCASRADSGSSNTTTSAQAYRARAMETRCFCPPLKLMPFSPISVRSRSGRIARSCSSPEAARTVP